MGDIVCKRKQIFGDSSQLILSLTLNPGIDKEVKFSKTVISAISRPPEKLCSVDTIEPETCITNYVSSLHLCISDSLITYSSHVFTNPESTNSGLF